MLAAAANKYRTLGKNYQYILQITGPQVTVEIYVFVPVLWLAV